MSAMLGGLRRLVANPGLWLGTWVGLAVAAALTGVLVRLVVASAVAPFGALDPDHLVFGMVEVLAEHRAIATTMMVGLVLSGVFSAITWALLSGLVIARLAGPRAWSEVGGRAVRHLPAVLVQSLWHAVLRGLVVLAMVLTVEPLPRVVGWSLLVVVWVALGVALDATRVAVVEHGAAPFHVRSTWQGLVHVARRPGLLVPCAVLSLGQLAITAGVLWLALAGMGGGSVWLPRLLALVSVGLGLWRVGAVVEQMRRHHDEE